MIRTIVWFTYFWLYLPTTIPALRKVKKLRKNGNDEQADQIVKQQSNKWAKRLVKLTGARVKIEGIERIPKDEPVLIVSNHQGNFDIPIILGYLDLKIGFISKVEVKKLPIIASWMEEMNCVFMDRKNRRQSVKAILQGAKQLKDGHNLVVFPEGTRSKGGPVSQFKQGSFKLATKSGAAILPVTINGSFKIMEANNNLMKPADVKVTIGEPVRIHQQNKDIDGITLAGIVQEEIEKNLDVQPPVKETV
ncbi:lysophospholipid acyltransferase family protein [Alteribacter keqinensis]|uniref:1-acyl-sn-glycerol-3-phosphate acyltransferase n=1 Tax=Alteribacter keqinensis TaxID=2483800 RepID=A0A3M7TP73_9BACI|nr:lysophospholipid acyltransferase family protein [Alteribacter keqinensis]RNA67054.1 1-acyl-sn-glycerol-3-phosphate acyltransferase [Alteribacter keqinensis]